MARIGVILFCCFLCCNLTGFQQADSVYFEENLQSLEYPFEDKKDTKQQVGFRLNSEIVKLVLVVLLIVFILSLLFFLSKLEGDHIRRDVKNEALLEKLNTETIQDDLLRFDIDQLILTAKHAGDLRLIHRAFFIGRIRVLHDAGLIHFGIDKTNRNYLNEIKAPEIKTAFQKITQEYEAIWFGKAMPESLNYEEMEQSYKEFVKTVSQAKKTVA